MANAIFLSIVVVGILLLLWWQRVVLSRGRQSEGAMAPDTASVDGGITTDKRIYFFHASHCGPCHAIAPLVDMLCREFPNLIKVDVADHPELAQGFGIAATPSFIVVDGKRIAEVKLGGVSESWLRGHLAQPIE